MGWIVSLAVTALAGFLRLWHLGQPHSFEFDETYYAKDAWSMWIHGYTTGYVETPTSSSWTARATASSRRGRA